MKNLLSIISFFVVWTSYALPPAEKQITAKAIHPRYREWAVPAGGEVVKQNPTAFLWPATDDKSDLYQVRLSLDNKFPKKNTVYSEWIEWAEYSHHKPLAKGHWYWQWAVKKTSGDITWSEVNDFVVDGSARNFATPDIKTLVKKVGGKSHPRLYVGRNDIDAFRERNKTNEEAKSLVRKAMRNVDMDVIPEAPTRPRDTTGLGEYEKDVMLRFMYHQFGDKVTQPIEDFSIAYLLTGDEKFARAIVKHAVHVAKMPTDSYATMEDFNRASIMQGLATAYDTAYDFMTPEERKLLLNSIESRGEYFFRHYVKDFEVHSMDNHVWQHTMRRFFLTSIATLGDIPQAEKWLGYCYETWCCRFPILGGDDGGWHDGSSYFPVNFETFIYVPFLLGELTSTNFFDLPWYRNLPQFLAYSFPKNSYSTGFGDGCENMNTPPKAYMGFADALARELKDPTARWYADQLIGDDYKNIYVDRKFALYRMLTSNDAENVRPVPPVKNTSKFFPDAGFSLMHTDPACAEDDFMAVFMGLPFGSTGHAHAAHNGFTINYGGKQMFGGSGHYSNFNDKHTLMHYRTRGHNTILADGMAQVIGENGYGWLARFADNETLTYTLGDATHAYDSIRTPFWIDRMEKSEVEYKLENGFGDPEVTRFRRHFVYLRPNIVVIYDELEAKKPVAWTWLLHSYNKMEKGIGKATRMATPLKTEVIEVENGAAKSRAQIFTNGAFTTSISNEFFSPALNWKAREGGDGKLLEYEKHWHTEFTTAEKNIGQRFVTIISLDPHSAPMVTLSGTTLYVGDWTVQAEFDAAKPARLSVSNTSGDGVLYNTESSQIEGSTVIMNNGKLQRELTDEIPLSVRLGTGK